MTMTMTMVIMMTMTMVMMQRPAIIQTHHDALTALQHHCLRPTLLIFGLLRRTIIITRDWLTLTLRPISKSTLSALTHDLTSFTFDWRARNDSWLTSSAGPPLQGDGDDDILDDDDDILDDDDDGAFHSSEK